MLSEILLGAAFKMVHTNHQVLQGLGSSSRYLAEWSDFILYSSSKNKLITLPMPPACKARKLQALT